MAEWYPYFSKKEMECRCGCGGLPSDRLMQILITIREEAGFPFVVNSGFRCPQHNSEVSETGRDGPHTLGLAVDLKVCGSAAVKILKLALKHGMTGVGVMQRGEKTKRFLHLDCIAPGEEEFSRPCIWSY